MGDYGAGQSGLVLIEQTGPFPPPEEAIAVAHQALRGKASGLPVPCMDCMPNLVLQDEKCPDCDEWEWALAVAHDDTCPTYHGLLSAPPRTTD